MIAKNILLRLKFILFVAAVSSVLWVTRADAQVVNVPSPVPTDKGFQGFIDKTTYFKTLTRATSYVGNNPGPVIIYSWDPTTKLTTITTNPPGASYDTLVCQGNIAILSNTQMEAYGTCCPTCPVNGDVDLFTLADPYVVSVDVTIGGPQGSGFENTVIDRDDPLSTSVDTLIEGTEVRSGITNGDYVVYKAYIADVTERANVSSYQWTASGPDNITGPSTAEWDLNRGNGLPWKPGDYFLNLAVTFKDGSSGNGAYIQHVAARATDVVVLGWINKSGVTVNTSGVNPDVLGTLPPGGFATYTSIIPGYKRSLQFFAAGYLFRLSTGSATLPSDRRLPLSALDKSYILNWMFKYAANNTPPSSFTSDELESFRLSGLGYKLFNRYQVDYDASEGPSYLDTAVALQKSADVGITTEPIFGLPVPAKTGLANDTLVPSNNDYFHINEGDPDSRAVAAFNTLVSPHVWNHIGSSIEEGENVGLSYNFLVQVYPTYYVYERDSNGVFQLQADKTVAQASDPSANCTSAPSTPYIPN